MQLQLALDLADRLHRALLVRGRPLETTEALRVLLATDHAGPLGLDILETLVREDSRFLWEQSDRNRLSLNVWEIPDPELCTVPFVALDLETTGARPGLAKITEVGAVRIEGLRAVRSLRALVNPLRPIPPMISRITGITADMVADAPRIEDVVPHLLDFLAGAVLVAHNAPFDVGFLNYELARLCGRRFDDGFVDTLPLARSLVPGLPNYRLGTVAEALGAPVTACHRALEDAQATAHVFLELTTRLQESGATRLGELRAQASPSAHSSLHKLSLTRDLPHHPGTYRFLGSSGEVLLVGHAERLDEGVRSHFCCGRRQIGKAGTAVRLVQRIDWQSASSPLEALVREQCLILEHQPPHNPQRSRPEEYVYISAGGSGPGLGLFAGNRAPRQPARGDPTLASATQSLTIGPFRRRSTVYSALRLLHSCYPIKGCPRRRNSGPCTRGELGLCLSPCIAHPAKIREHDLLVASVMWWLAGYSVPGLADPLHRAEEVAWELGRQERYEEARALRASCDDLRAIQRSYSALAEARGLSFACLWPQASTAEEPLVRLNLVWQGVLQEPVSIRSRSTEEQIDRVLDPVRRSLRGPSPYNSRALLAVPRRQLDSLLAMSRWFSETGRRTAVAITRRGEEPADVETVRSRLLAEAHAFLAKSTPAALESRRGF